MPATYLEDTTHMSTGRDFDRNYLSTVSVPLHILDIHSLFDSVRCRLLPLEEPAVCPGESLSDVRRGSRWLLIRWSPTRESHAKHRAEMKA